LKFEQEDWSLFRTVDGLQQRAGVAKGNLRRLVLKELADNALDETNKDGCIGAQVALGRLDDGRYFVEDNGRGIDGSPEQIADLFSIGRPLRSTKRLRMPSRGALGNGLRVVAGAVIASEGALAVTTRNRRIQLCPERDGSTTVLAVEDVEHPIGTRIEIGFGPALPTDDDTLDWANAACDMASHGTLYQGKSSPHWYDAAQFRELLYIAGGRSVREFISQLDGCTGGKAGEIVDEANLDRVRCNEVTLHQARTLLVAARQATRPVQPKRLGAVGEGYASSARPVLRNRSASPSPQSRNPPPLISRRVSRNCSSRSASGNGVTTSRL
jgi:hypothetical protein